MTPLAATVRDQAANYVSALVFVYSAIIIAYILSTLFFAVGGRVPYSRGVNAVLTFLREVSEPYLRLFRRLLPMAGPLDLSPMLGLITLGVVGSLLVSVIRG